MDNVAGQAVIKSLKGTHIFWGKSVFYFNIWNYICKLPLLEIYHFLTERFLFWFSTCLDIWTETTAQMRKLLLSGGFNKTWCATWRIRYISDKISHKQHTQVLLRALLIIISHYEWDVESESWFHWFWVTECEPKRITQKDLGKSGLGTHSL